MSTEVRSGPVREARNWSSDARGSIHDDSTASKLGFRGGTVAGSIHMDQFAPLLLELFGPRWFEAGALSLGFLNATTDHEPVRAFAEQPSSDPSQIRVWMNRVGDDLPVAAGTASLVDHSRSELATRDLRGCDPERLRILRELRPGMSLGEHELRLDPSRQLERIAKDLISGPLDWYAARSPWGGPIGSLSTAVELLWFQPTQALTGRIGRAVGLFGAIEVAHHHGPLLLDRRYRVAAEVVALSESPRTEVLWFDSTARDEAGKRVATLRMMLRFMKASSPLWSDA